MRHPPAGIVVRKLRPQIVQAQRTQYRVGDRMEQGIAVRMGDRAHLVFDMQTAQHQGHLLEAEPIGGSRNHDQCEYSDSCRL